MERDSVGRRFRIRLTIAATLLLLAACGSREERAPGNETDSRPAEASEARTVPAGQARLARAAQAAERWDLQSSGEGTALALLSGSGGTSIRLFCPSGPRRLLVNVPAFRPIGSEERLSFGSGGEAHALVADTRGDRRRGGVSGTGAVPANLATLVGGPVSASYGAQTSGPHAAPPPELARAFVRACSEGAAATRPSASGPAANPCLVQDGKPLAVAPLRAVGTEPFWGARIEGRCVTYSHPDDQKGTRVWTRYAPGDNGGGTWSGALGGRRFELTTRARSGCSDGMSDRRYPMAVDLIVGGERRSGCAEPL